MDLKDLFPNTWVKASDLEEITKESMPFFGINNLNRIRNDGEYKMNKEKNLDVRKKYKLLLCEIYLACLESKDLPILPELRYGSHFNNGDRIFVFKDNEFYLANVNCASNGLSSLMFTPKEGCFEMPDRYISIYKHHIVKAYELVQLCNNEDYLNFWIKICGITGSQIEAYKGAVKRAILRNKTKLESSH